MNTDAVPRVVATPAAAELIGKLKSEHGDVLFHRSGGCCDGSAPFLNGKEGHHAHNESG